jgi:hypothetical protein
MRVMASGVVSNNLHAWSMNVGARCHEGGD